MRIALTHNLRLTQAVEDAEFDPPETIDAIARSLGRAGHDVERVDVGGPPSRLVARLEAYSPDVIFNIAEGRRGRVRRGFYAALFEEMGMPATGSDAYTLCVTLDKALTKRVLAGCGVPTPRGRLVTRASLRAGALDDVQFPLIAKPNYEGSSKGITQRSVVEDPHDLSLVVGELLEAYPDGVLLERYVPGIDVRVYKVDGLGALPPVEVRVDPAYPRRFPIYDYALAHEHASAVSMHPARLSAEVAARLGEVAERIFVALGIRDLGFLDFRITPEGEVHFLSATPLPSLEPDGPLAVAARLRGVDYDGAILAILRAACARSKLLPQLGQTKPRARARRTWLKVGLAFNMKRIGSAADDREAEYDPPETIEAITKAIESHGHVVVPLEANADFPRALLTSGVDVVFNVAEGIRGRNREAQVPSLCELLGVPYSGSDSATLSICLDKGLAKRLLKDATTPEWQVLVTGREKLRSFRYPVIVKPNAEGTSKGITGKSVVDDEAGVRELAREIIDRYGQPALVEEYIFGREFTVGLLGERRPRVLPPMEVAFLSPSERPIYDYACKQDWQRFVRYEVPAHLTKDELRAIERAARATFTSLGCRDVARVDLRLTPNGKVYVIEVNPLPGLTPDYSDLCLIANGAGMDYRTLIGEILSGAIKR
ncbi:MAG TPA: ATP-grasp domain-containing protein, partial [Polyangiaceae bacterium]|nr:ATP-grasp domain-containing protein [Polyangiaceae bacterium]